ncbi:nucleotide sugar dehydrogenase [Microbulbifer sp. EKSA008]|uniref:nucleotide sugar dehydrogenase n=1 Tax=unclassified Microbulbifer TaxID=2619833 RepID=UPI004039865B
MSEAFIKKIKSKETIVGIVGLGYVGLPLSIRFAEAGFVTVGFDIDESKAEAINVGKSYIEHIPCEQVRNASEKGLSATTDFSKMLEVDALILCVPTPLNRYREPDLSFVTGTLDKMLPYLRKGQLVSLESTTYPGTTEEEVVPRVEKAGLIAGKDVHIVYSPEREDPGNKNFSTQNIPKVCGGYTAACLNAGVALYNEVIDKVVPVSSVGAAEMTKLLENIHRAVNIGLVNEMKIVADAMGIDIHEVIRAAATKPFGFTPYYPGPGLGGHCIPIDPFYLTWKAREYGLHTRFIELAGEINTMMPEWVVNKVVASLNSVKKSVNGSKILILGIAYKKNVDDMRESPSMELLRMLLDLGADVSYSDPHVPSIPKMRKYDFSMSSVNLNQVDLLNYDLVLLATDHDAFDYELLAEKSQLLVDTRGRYTKKIGNIVKA